MNGLNLNQKSLLETSYNKANQVKNNMNSFSLSDPKEYFARSVITS